MFEGEVAYDYGINFDELYLNAPYYIIPDGEVGQQALR